MRHFPVINLPVSCNRKGQAKLKASSLLRLLHSLEGMEVRVVDPRQLPWPGDLADDWDADAKPKVFES